MSSYSELYWLTRLDNLQGLFMGFSIFTGVMLLAYYLVAIISICDEYLEWDNKNRFKIFAKNKIIYIVGWIFNKLSYRLINPNKRRDNIYKCRREND